VREADETDDARVAPERVGRWGFQDGV